jgi:hypothetical protein
MQLAHINSVKLIENYVKICHSIGSVMKQNATLNISLKHVLNSGLVIEIKIWKLENNKEYEEGVKYRLVLADPIRKKVLLLFDNHFPKKHHYHDHFGREMEYKFTTIKELLTDFFNLCSKIEGEYESTEN